MATIKSYTDLEQSKKLAEFLPLESADMKILPFTEREYRIVPINDISVCGREDEIYAWSLAALFNLCPTINGKQPILTRGKLTRLWYCYYEDEIDTQTYNNPIDACYEMILKLNEQKLL